jgi:ADP-ribose pyrophosphatase YjhB (NUDIX family)
MTSAKPGSTIVWRASRTATARFCCSVSKACKGWFLPGGRVEMSEAATVALAREIGEEFGVLPQMGRLLWVVENFFSLDGRNFHELGLYFAMELPETVPKDGEFKVVEPNQTLWNRWVPLEDLAHQQVVPKFLRTALHNPPAVPTHIVNVD